MTRSAIRLFVVALGLSMVACSGTPSNRPAAPASTDPVATATPAEQIASKPTGLLIEPIDALKLGYSIDWATHLNITGDRSLYSVTQLGDLLITIERPSNVVTAISMKDGKQLWRQQAGNAPYRALAASRVDNKIYVNTETAVYVFDAAEEGKLLSRIELASAVSAGPAMIGEIAVFGGTDGMVFGLDTRSGYARWRYKMPGQVLVAPQAVGQQVFVIGIDGQYVLINGSSGEFLWRGRVFDKVSAAPAVHSTGIYVASEDHSLYALSRVNREDRWVFRYTDDLTTSPLVLRSTVYQALPGGHLVALKVTDGSELWRLKTNNELIGQDTRGLIFNGGNAIVIRDPASSKLIEQAPVQDILKDLLHVDGKSLVLVSREGRILKMSQVN